MEPSHADLDADRTRLKDIDLRQRALRAKEKAWGMDHPTTLDTVADLGRLYAAHGNVVEAEKMYSRALSGCETIHGKVHPTTQAVVQMLEDVRARLG